MILSDGEIQEALKQKKILIDPLPRNDQYTTSALDLHMADELWELRTPEELASEEPAGVERGIVVDLMKVDIRDLLQRYAKPVPRESNGSFIIQPAKFLLSQTLEFIDLPRKSKIAARVEGRSTLARLGLVVHMTAPTIHCGFEGTITLEMYNFGTYPLRVFPGTLAICQLIFEKLTRVPKGPVRTKYLRQRSLTRKQG